MKTRAPAAYVLLLVAALAAGTLLLLSWPRLRASVMYLPVDTAISKYYASRVIPSTQLTVLIERAQQAIELHDHYRYHDGLSILYYLRGTDERSPGQQWQGALEKAIKEAENVVSVAPARPMAWQRIARTHALLQHPAEHIVQALKMSIYAGRIEPTLLLGRLELGYYYLDQMDAEARALLHDQTLLAWRLQPRALSKAISQQRLAWTAVQQLLGAYNDPELAVMEATLGRAVH